MEVVIFIKVSIQNENVLESIYFPFFVCLLFWDLKHIFQTLMNVEQVLHCFIFFETTHNNFKE